MSLKTQIETDIKIAMRAKDTVRRDILRVVKGDIERGEQTKNGKVVVSDEDIIKLVKKTIQGIKETSNDTQEIEILEVYLPKQLSEGEVRAKLEKIISEIGATNMKDMGKVMGTFNSKYNGMADGKLVSDIVKQSLL